MPNVILYRRIIDDGKFHKDNEKPATSVKKNSSVKGSSKNKKRKKNATISALSAALRQRLS